MIRAAVLLLLLLATPAQADDGWFFFFWDAARGTWDRSPKTYPTLVTCERAGLYKTLFSEGGSRYLVAPCFPADASTPPLPGTRFVLEGRP